MRVRIQSKSTGLFLCVDKTAGLSDIGGASSFHIQEGVVKHRGKSITLRDGALVVSSTRTLRYERGQLLSGVHAVASTIEGFQWIPADPKDAQQWFVLHDIQMPQVPHAKISEPDMIISVADLKTIAPSRRVTKVSDDTRLNDISHILRDSDAGLYVLHNVDERTLLLLMRLDTFPNCRLGECQLMTTDHLRRCAIVFDPQRFETRRAIEVGEGGGIIAMLRNKARGFEFILACLNLSSTSPTENNRILAHLNEKVRKWPPSLQKLAIYSGGESQAVDDSLSRMGWQKTEPSRENIFCAGFESEVFASTDRITLSNGTVIHGAVRAEYSQGIYIVVKRNTVWIARNRIRDIVRGADRHDAIAAPTICALKVYDGR